MPVWGSYAKAQTVEPYAVYDLPTGTLTFKCDDARPSEAYSLNTAEEYQYPLWTSYNNETITKVVFDASFAKARPTTCLGWFAGLENLTEIEGIENLNTENVTEMSYMFYGCAGLTSLDVSKFDTKNVKDMSYMFYGCAALTSLDLSNFNTGNLTNMDSMFSDCAGLIFLDLSGLNTENVTYMSVMFRGCSSLTSLNLSNFNTEKVELMHSMFEGCTSLSSLNISTFNTQNVIFMEDMFNGCSGLTSLDVSNFNTQKVLYMNGMFEGCTSLTTLDLSSFNTEDVKNMSFMFTNNSKLKTIYASDKFVANDVYGEDMFLGCTSLKGAIAYDENKTDSRYANTTDGYFTLKNASGINALTTPNNETTEYFNLLGVRANNKHKGINIVRRGNKTMKVLVK